MYFFFINFLIIIIFFFKKNKRLLGQMNQNFSIGESKETKNEFYKRLMLFNMVQQVKDELKSNSNEQSEKCEDSREISDDHSLNSFEKIDEEQLFFNQKRERIKKKIEQNSQNFLNKEKTQNKALFKQNNTNFIEKNSNLNELNTKKKAQIKRLNGMSVRISKINPKLEKL